MPNQSLTSNITLFLFHNDLRVTDNATLSKAAHLSSNGQLLLVYAPSLTDTLDKKVSQQVYHYDSMGQARQRFLSESLAALDASLMQLGNKLLYLQNNVATSDTFTQLNELIQQQNVTDICVSQTADYNQNHVYKCLQEQNPQVCWHVQTTATLFDKLPLDELPKSFTAFRKKIESNYDLLQVKKIL